MEPPPHTAIWPFGCPDILNFHMRAARFEENER
jgi:hypothetical protein